MQETFVGGALVVITCLAAIILMFGDKLFARLPRVQRLEQIKARVGAITIAGSRIGFDPVTLSPRPTESIFALSQRQLEHIAFDPLSGSDQFKTMSIAVDIVSLRAEVHEGLLEEVRALAAVLVFLFLASLVIVVSEEKSPPTISIILKNMGKDWHIALGLIELLTMIFLVIRFIREYRDLKHLVKDN